MNNYSIMNEVYFGKNKNILRIEKCISVIRNKYKNEILIVNIENTPEWKALKKAFEDTFGFYSVTLIFDRSSLPNAYTCPITMTFETYNSISTKPYISKKYGIRFRPEDHFCTLIAITEGLLFNEDITDAEITAILLHEVGHNFDCVGYNHLIPLTLIQLIIKLITDIQSGRLLGVLLSFNSYRTPLFNAINTLQGTPLWTIVDLFSKLISVPSGLIQKLFMPLIKIAVSIAGNMLVIFSPLVALFITYTNYSREQFADKFPVMLGYGPEYTSGMSKMESVVNNIGLLSLINRIPIIAHLYCIMACMLGFLGKAIDPHPEYAARIQSAINMLESDLNDKRIDPKAKILIKNDLKKIKYDMNKYLDNPITYGDSVYNEYQKWLLNNYPGAGDIRSSMLRNDNIDDDTIRMNFNKLHRVKEEAYIEGFNDTIETFLEYVGNKDYAFGDGKITKRRLSKVKKIPKHKKGYKPKWG